MCGRGFNLISKLGRTGSSIAASWPEHLVGWGSFPKNVALAGIPKVNQTPFARSPVKGRRTSKGNPKGNQMRPAFLRVPKLETKQRVCRAYLGCFLVKGRYTACAVCDPLRPVPAQHSAFPVVLRKGFSQFQPTK